MFKFGNQILASHANDQTHKFYMDRGQMFFKEKCNGDKNEPFISTEESITSSQVQLATKTKATAEPSLELLLEDGQKK